MKTYNYSRQPEITEHEETNVLIDKDREYTLLLINDHFNTFEHVIYCLQKYCGHSIEQAEQCALITHYKGQCDIKRGSFRGLEPICKALLESGLTTEII